MKQLLATGLILVLFVTCVSHINGQATKGKAAQTQGGTSLSDRVQQLMDMNHKKPVLRFNSNKFRDFVKATPRNYSMVVMFTALSAARQCGICRQAHDEFVIAANSYRHSASYSNRLFFVMVDFDEGKEVFQSLRLNTAPVFMHFPAKGKPKAADNMDVQRMGFNAEVIARWVQERTDVQIRVFRPPNYLGTIATLGLVAFIAGFLYLRRNNLDFLANKKFWGIAALVFCFIMISGQMWNHIRGPPFMHRSQNGNIAYIHGSSQGQLVVETYIVMFLNAMIVVGMILLTDAGSHSDTKRNKLMVIIGLAMVLVFFSLILSVFRSKAQGYPYSLFLL